MAYAVFGAGILLLAIGCEAALRGSAAAARAFGISPLVLGILLLSVASAPALCVALQASYSGVPEIGLATIVGANTLNLLFALGLGALIRPLASPPKVVLRDGGSLLAASVMLVLLAWGHLVSRGEGALLLVGFAAYLALVFFTDWRRPPEHSIATALASAHTNGREISLTASLFIVLFGLICLVLGAHFAVGGAIRSAKTLNLSQTAFALVPLAFGVSAPRIAATVVAAIRNRADLVVGSAIALSAINVLGAIGFTAAIRPLPISSGLASTDILVMFGATAILLPMLSTSWRLSRPQGFLLLVCYFGYIAFVAWREGLFGPTVLAGG